MYGILHSNVNTGHPSELKIGFVAPLTIQSNQPAIVTDSLSLRRRVSYQKVQRWEITTNLDPENTTANYLVHSVRNGYTEIFYIRMPQVFRFYNNMPKNLSLVLASSAQAGDTSINISGLGLNEMNEGEFINLYGDSKVYLVVKAGSGGAGVEIYPPLMSSKAAGLPILYGDTVTMAARYNSDVILGIKYTDGVLSDPGSVKLIEAL
jgi:hypothetical protein